MKLVSVIYCFHKLQTSKMETSFLPSFQAQPGRASNTRLVQAVEAEIYYASMQLYSQRE
jgi:hypothetical protein